MSEIVFQCPTCGSGLTVPGHLAGVTGPCPICRSDITAPAAPVPAQATPAGPEPEPERQPQPAAPGAQAQAHAPHAPQPAPSSADPNPVWGTGSPAAPEGLPQTPVADSATAAEPPPAPTPPELEPSPDHDHDLSPAAPRAPVDLAAGDAFWDSLVDQEPAEDATPGIDDAPAPPTESPREPAPQPPLAGTATGIDPASIWDQEPGSSSATPPPATPAVPTPAPAPAGSPGAPLSVADPPHRWSPNGSPAGEAPPPAPAGETEREFGLPTPTAANPPPAPTTPPEPAAPAPPAAEAEARPQPRPSVSSTRPSKARKRGRKPAKRGGAGRWVLKIAAAIVLGGIAWGGYSLWQNRTDGPIADLVAKSRSLLASITGATASPDASGNGGDGSPSPGVAPLAPPPAPSSAQGPDSTPPRVAADRTGEPGNSSTTASSSPTSTQNQGSDEEGSLVLLDGMDAGHLEHSVSLDGTPAAAPPAELTLDSNSAALSLRDAAPGAAPPPPVADATGTTNTSGPGTAPVTPAVDDQSSILREPREVLQSFLAAPDWKSRLEFVQHRETIAPLMEAYYADNPDGPVAASSISFQNSDRVPNSDFLFYLFHITTEAVPEGFPVSVEESAEGFKVDWRTFVEFNDQQLFRFLSNPGLEDARVFHVIMRRTHYFGSDVPDLSQKYAFRIEPPIPGVHGYAFVDREAPLASEKLTYQLQWPAVSYPVVKLKWTGPPNGPRYIEVVDLVQNNWRSDPVGVPGNVAEVPSE